MNMRLAKNTLLATAAASAPGVLAPSVEAAPTVNQRTGQQVRALGREILRLGDNHTSVIVSKDKRGNEKATYRLKLDARSGTPPNDSTGEYDFTLVTAARGRRPQPQKPRALRIAAESHTGASGGDRLVVDYKLDPREHAWGVSVDSEHEGQPSSTSPIVHLGGAYEHQFVPSRASNARELNVIFTELAKPAILAASEGQPIGDQRRHLPIS